MTITISPELQQLKSSVGQPDGPELKVALSRVALEVNTRLQEGSATSAEYMTTVIKTLKGVAGSSHHELRINCLTDVSHFFYILGDSFKALEPARDAALAVADAP